MKRHLLFLPALLVLFWGSVSHASLLQNGSFEASAPVQSGFQDLGVWYTDGYERTDSSGAADGAWFAAPPDASNEYQLFQTIEIGWSGPSPTTGDFSLNYKRNSDAAPYGALTVNILANTGPPVEAYPEPGNSFGDEITITSGGSTSRLIQDTDWLTDLVTFEFTIDPTKQYTHYTLYLKSTNAAVDAVELNIDGAFAVPLPSAVLLLGTGLVGILGWRHRRKA